MNYQQTKGASERSKLGGERPLNSNYALSFVADRARTMMGFGIGARQQENKEVCAKHQTVQEAGYRKAAIDGGSEIHHYLTAPCQHSLHERRGRQPGEDRPRKEWVGGTRISLRLVQVICHLVTDSIEQPSSVAYTYARSDAPAHAKLLNMHTERHTRMQTIEHLPETRPRPTGTDEAVLACYDIYIAVEDKSESF